MAKILCSTGALIGKPNHADYRLLEKLSEELLCDGYEFMMFEVWYDRIEEVTDFLQRKQLYIPVMHCEKHIGQAVSRGGEEDLKEAFRRFELNCGMAERLKAEKIVIHLWDGLISDKNFDNNLAAYAKLEEISRKHGVDLLVENVVCNQEDPMSHWCQLARVYPDIHFVFDTKMAAFHGQLDLLYEERYSWLWKEGHIRHYHVNDYAGGYKEWSRLATYPIGAGNIDFEKFFRFIRDIKYDATFTVEATAYDQEGRVDVEMLNGCFRYIREHVMGKEK